MVARKVHVGKVSGYDAARPTETWYPNRAIVRDNPTTEVTEAMLIEFKAQSDSKRHMR